MIGMIEMTAMNEMTVLNEIVMPVMFFQNGEVAWINNRGKDLLNIKSISDLKEKHFMKYLDKKQIEEKSLREVVNQLNGAFSDKESEKNLKIALRIKGSRVEAALKIVPVESGLPYSGFVIFDRIMKKEDVLLRKKT